MDELEISILNRSVLLLTKADALSAKHVIFNWSMKPATIGFRYSIFMFSWCRGHFTSKNHPAFNKVCRASTVVFATFNVKYNLPKYTKYFYTVYCLKIYNVLKTMFYVWTIRFVTNFLLCFLPVWVIFLFNTFPCYSRLYTWHTNNLF